jgi:Tol biopolymer transport system component
MTSPDTAGNAGEDMSLALDAMGFPVVSYVDATNSGLRVLHCNDINCAGGNESITSPDTTAGVGEYSSLMLDSSGLPVIGYYDYHNGALRVMRCDDPNCAGGGESIVTPDAAGDVGVEISLVLDAIDRPVISYGDLDSGYVKILHCGNSDCSASNSITAPIYALGLESSIVLDGSGYPVVATYDDDLFVMRCNDVNCAGGNESISSPDTAGFNGAYPSLTLNASGWPVVSYWDVTNGDLKVLHCGSADCTSGNSIASPDTAGSVGLHTSIALDGSGNPVVSYYDTSDDDLKVLHCGAPDCMAKSMKSYGFKIAFTTNRDGNGNEVYVMNADGTGQTRITDNEVSDISPAWSPDGTKIAFRTNRDGNDNIYVMNADGTNQTQLTDEPAVDADPVWSPDGAKIAFTSNRTGTFEIYVMNADGSAETNISNTAGNDVQPDWSPDGTKLAFTTDRNGGVVGSGDIYTMNADGSSQTNLTPELIQGSGAPAWSPDGTRIAFHHLDGNYAVWGMNPNGSNKDVLAFDFDNSTWPTWKAGGEKIAYTSDSDGNSEIYTMDSNGFNHVNATSHGSNDEYADWRRVSGPGLDFDQDGCTDAKEAGPDQTLGGLRSPQNFWDFFDTPNASNARDKSVSGTDFFNILARFGSSGSPSIDPLSPPPSAPAYHTAYDRGPAPGGQNGWRLTAANGAIAGTDFFSVLAQFGHSCA